MTTTTNHLGRAANHSEDCPTPGKYAYPTHWLAARHCAFLNSDDAGDDKERGHREPYRCYGCQQWHLRNTAKNQRRYDQNGQPVPLDKRTGNS